MEYFGGLITIILSILAIQLVYVAVIAFFGVNTNPIIDNVNDEIISSPSIFFIVSTSCLYFKNIRIDKRKKIVKISKRILWFFK